MNEKIKVYVKADENSNITAVNSSIFLSDTSGWIEIDEGSGDKYAHAQGSYFSKPVTDFNGICRYKLIDSEIIEKSDAEMAAEYVPPPAPLTIDDLAAAVAELAEVIANG